MEVHRSTLGGKTRWLVFGGGQAQALAAFPDEEGRGEEQARTLCRDYAAGGARRARAVGRMRANA